MQYVDTLVIAPDLKVAALGAIPLVEVLDHLDLTSTQAKSSGHLDPAMAGIGLYPNLHVRALFINPISSHSRLQRNFNAFTPVDVALGQKSPCRLI